MALSAECEMVDAMQNRTSACLGFVVVLRFKRRHNEIQQRFAKKKDLQYQQFLQHRDETAR